MRRLIGAAISLVVIGGAIAATQISGDAELPGLPGFGSYQPAPSCIEDLPDEVTDPQFRPPALTLPEGSYAVRTPEDPAPGLHIVVYLVKASLDEFADYVLKEWPDNGWVLGRGEREPGEAESVFFLPDKSRYGHLRARSIYCDPSLIELTLTLGENVR